MKLLIALIFIMFATASFSQDNKGKATALYPEIARVMNEKHRYSNGDYWMLIPISDSSCKIKWHTKSFTKTSKSNFEFYAARNFYLEWRNDDFIILHTHTGSDAWFDVVLPLKNNDKEMIIDSPIAFDLKSNLIAQISAGDTILKVINLTTGKRQSIIENKNRCTSAFNNYCIDRISVSKNILYFSWMTPSKFNSKAREVRKIKLHL